MPPIRRISSVTGSVVPPNVPKLPGFDGKNLRSQSEGKITDKSVGSDVDEAPLPVDQASEGEYVNFTVSGDGDRDSVDDLPLPPPPEELSQIDHNNVDSKEVKADRPKIKRTNSIVATHGDIINMLNQKLGGHPESPQPIYAVPALPNTPPTSLACQPHYASLQESTIPIYATPYAQPVLAPSTQNHLPLESPDSADDITPTGDPPSDNILIQIKRGVSLRRTATCDRSAPVL
jgi:hypothetical protein